MVAGKWGTHRNCGNWGELKKGDGGVAAVDGRGWRGVTGGGAYFGGGGWVVVVAAVGGGFLVGAERIVVNLAKVRGGELGWKRRARKRFRGYGERESDFAVTGFVF
jgi:hypothetical protein